MNKYELTKYMSLSLSISMEESNKVVNTFLQAFEDGLCHGGEIRLHNFGIFTLKHLPERVGWNPKTKESYVINERIGVKFQPSMKFLSKLNNTQSPAKWKTGEAERTTIDKLNDLIK